jgi:2-polyprenyl-3-methyl-5-hydroxy-6-metoxy-1,4-benzoquinol methylase
MLRNGLIKLYYAFLQLSLRPVLKKDYNVPTFNTINERSTEYSFVFRNLSRICPKEILDVGTGKSSLPHLMVNCGFKVTAMDKMESFWKSGFINRHYYIIKDDITNPQISKSFDMVTAISVLEHIPTHKEAIDGMFSLLKPGGHLLLTFPYNENKYINNVYELHGQKEGQDSLPYICQVYSRNEINNWIDGNGKIIDQEYYRVFTGDYWSFGERIYPLKKVTNQEPHHLTCILIQKN